MEFLLTKNPQFSGKFESREVKDFYKDLVEDADQFNIATGFVSNVSILELEDLVTYRQKNTAKAMKLNLFIGMNYIEQFTKLQYDALMELNKHLQMDNLGDVFVSKELRYHGKMYSFLKNGVCEAGFIGSSNLGSFKAGKSNLNTYFGAGKIKGRFSPRNWYEVEIIISKKLENLDKLPQEDEEFTVITDDHFMFKCKRQGDYGKNLRTVGDLRILGKWIKGHMEAEGALKLGEMVTEETLEKFHKSKLVFTPTKSGIWLLKME